MFRIEYTIDDTPTALTLIFLTFTFIHERKEKVLFAFENSKIISWTVKTESNIIAWIYNQNDILTHKLFMFTKYSAKKLINGCYLFGIFLKQNFAFNITADVVELILNHFSSHK